jgi:hypothetical protein
VGKACSEVGAVNVKVFLFGDVHFLAAGTVSLNACVNLRKFSPYLYSAGG